jgi:hypothetical protein
VKVLINGRYAYETDLEDIEIGDEMVLPGGMGSDLWKGIVTALEPEYHGPCRKVIGLSRRKSQVEKERKALAEVQMSGWSVGDKLSKRCQQCGKQRWYLVKEVNRVGRPTSIESLPCECGASGLGAHLGSAAAFRYFMNAPPL